MIGGLTLGELSQRLLDDARAHRDFIADTRKIDVDVVDGKPAVQFATTNATIAAAPTQHALRQIGAHVDIPAKYLDRMATEAPSLLAANVNHWFRANPSPRMLRTKMNGGAVLRAFLSNRYRPLDNHDLAEVVIPQLLAPGWEIKSAQITDTRFYIQAVSTKLAASIAHGRQTGVKDDVVHPGIVISNSEVGAGALSVEPMIFRLICLNGMIAGTSIRRNHVGRTSNGGGDDAYEFYSDETRRLDDAALWSKVRDTVDAAVTDALFHRLVSKLNAASGDGLGDDPVSVVEVGETSKTFLIAYRRFTADASHELRAPLAVVTAEADLALTREARPPTEYAVSLRAIQAEARLMETLIDDLLWSARADESKQHCVLIDLGDALIQNRPRLDAVVAAGGARLSVDAQAGVKAKIDRTAFTRALLAVVHNAAKFASNEVNVKVSDGSHHVEVAVLDDGPGFSQSGLLNATERFWREDRSRGTSGNGLGLSIARSIVEGCGGHIVVDNRREGGAVITLRLKK
jgi:signal transduction histidine kinase